MLKKFCKCGILIPIEQKMCSKCLEKYNARQEVYNKNTYKNYKNKRIDFKEQKFYNSKDWKITRSYIKSRDKGLCLLCLSNNSIQYLTKVHHIIELKEDYSLRTNTSNLIGLCDRCHSRVHRVYNKSINDKRDMQDKLKALVIKG